MKKITFTLLAAGLISSSAFSQVNAIISAPNTIVGSTAARAPNGNANHTTFRSMYNIPASALTGLGANVVSFGFDYDSGVGSPASGNMTIWMQNTPNNTYNLGTTWSTAGFTQVYSGIYNLPQTNNVQVDIPITSFPYSGGAINVLIDYVGNTFDPTFSAFYNAYQDPNGVAWGSFAASPNATSPVNTATTAIVPIYRFGYPNPVTNDIEVVRVIAHTKLPKGGQVVEAEIKNKSNTTLNNINLAMGATGVNTAGPLLQSVASLGAGLTTTVSFASFNSPVQGIQTISVGLAGTDQNNANNIATLSQSVTCDRASYNPHNLANSAYANGIGFTQGNLGLFLKRFTPQQTGTVKAAMIAIGSETVNVNKPIYGVLCNAAGAIVATTNTITITNATAGTFQKFEFATPPSVTMGTDYFLGCAQTTGSTFPIGMATQPASVIGDRMYSAPLAGGTPNQILNIGYFGIEAIYSTANPTVNVVSTKSVICKGETVVLTASGGANYAWVSPVINTATASVSPTITTTYTVNVTDASGCSNKGTFTQTVAICTGLMVNAVNGSEIKVFPNPAVNGKSEISGLNGVNRIVVYNILGQSVMTHTTEAESLTIDLANQPNGTYLVKITDESNNSKTVKIVNQN